MDSMHPDPAPAPPPSLSEIRSQINRLEDALRSKGHPLSGRIIHVCHHLPLEIIRIVSPSAVDVGGVFSPPMTPDFKPEDADAQVESVDAKWRIHARTAHTAMVSGIRSLSESHEQILVAWTGEVMIQTQTVPSPLGSLRSLESDGASTTSGIAPASKPKMVYGGEFSDQEKKELGRELERFTDVETKAESGGRLEYVPVFLPPDVSKGHYEGFCKKSKFRVPSGR